MRENIRRIARLLEETARELERIGQLEVENEEIYHEFRGLTRSKVVDKIFGLRKVMPLNFPAGRGYFTVEEAADGDKIWKGEPILLKGTFEWLGRRFKHAECVLWVFPDGAWDMQDVAVRFGDGAESYWTPRGWEFYDEETQKHILSTGEKIS